VYPVIAEKPLKQGASQVIMTLVPELAVFTVVGGSGTVPKSRRCFTVFYSGISSSTKSCNFSWMSDAELTRYSISIV
jgi:hypothetical protein